jgi:hypothetical protein
MHLKVIWGRTDGPTNQPTWSLIEVLARTKKYKGDLEIFKIIGEIIMSLVFIPIFLKNEKITSPAGF